MESSWPLPVYWSEDWLIETPPEVRTVVLEALDGSEVDRNDAWWTVTPEPEFRTLQLPFYQDVLLVEFQIPRAFEEGWLVGSYLVSRTPVTEAGGVPAHQSFKLNGTSPPIHEVNGAKGLILETADQAIAYLKFFCAHVWGDEGGFWVCDSPADVPWLPSAGEEKRRAAESLIRAPNFISGDEKVCRIDAVILYGGYLFSAHFEIQKTGMLEMTEDRPLMAAPLDVLPDRRLHGYRVVSPVAPRRNGAAG